MSSAVSTHDPLPKHRCRPAVTCQHTDWSLRSRRNTVLHRLRVSSLGSAETGGTPASAKLTKIGRRMIPACLLLLLLTLSAHLWGSLRRWRLRLAWLALKKLDIW